MLGLNLNDDRIRHFVAFPAEEEEVTALGPVRKEGIGSLIGNDGQRRRFH